MSGGHFNYNQSHIRNIKEHLEELLNRQNTLKPTEDLFLSEEYYKEFPEESLYEVYSGEVQKRFKEAIEVLKRVYIYVQRIDWYLSGDDGEESFLERLEEELKKLEEKQ